MTTNHESQLHKFDMLVQPGRAHRSIYVDDDIFAEEMSKIFGGTWVFLVHESQIAEPNDFVTTRLGLRSLIVTRDQDGAIHAFLNRCSHRASTVCQEEDGNAKRFTCGYHGWTYSNTGALVGLPYPNGYPIDFDRSDRGLHALPRLASYRGFVFGSLNPDVPELDKWLGPARPYLDYFIDRVPDGELEVRNSHRLRFKGNWKLAWDNAGDGLHATYTHRSFALLNDKLHGGGRSLTSFMHSPDDTGMFSEDLGHGHMFLDQRPGLKSSFWQTQRPVPGTEAFEQTIVDQHGRDLADELLEMVPGSMINLSIFPNLLIKGNQMEVVTPLATGETELVLWVTAAKKAPDEVNTLRMRIAEDFTTIGNPDDIEMFERCQAGLMVPEVEWVDMSKGLGTEEIESRDGIQVRRSPVTYDTLMRGYLEEWKRLMATDVKLIATAVAVR